jgi:O-antigen/teichoic acid export membrane protein
MFIMIWTTAMFSFWANEQRVTYSSRTLVIVTLIASFSAPFLGIFLILHSDDKVTARILGIVLVELIAYSWMFFYQMKKGKTFFSKRFWLYALGFNLPLVPHYLSQTVLNSSDRIMIQRMIGESEAGIYNLAYSLSLIMTIFNTALMQTINPWMYQKIKDKKGKEIGPIAYGTLILIAVVNLMLILLAPEAVAIFAPASYYDAIWVIPPVAMSVFFMYSYDLFAKFAFYYEKTKFIMMASVAGATLNIVLNYICIKAFGYVAAGYTTLTCYIVYCIAHYLFMKKVCDQFCEGEYPYETKKIMKIAIPFLAAGFGLLFTYNFPIVRYGIVVVAAVLVVIMRKKFIAVIRELMSVRKKST